MSSKNSRTSNLYRTLLNHTDKIKLKISDKYVGLANLRIYHTLKIFKNHTKIMILRYQLSR